MFLTDWFHKITNIIANLFRDLDSDKAKKVYAEIISLAAKALPVIKLVAALTPDPTDDLVIAALEKLGLTAKQVLDSTNDLIHDANRQNLAIEILKQDLLNEFNKSGKFSIGDFAINSVEDILKLDKSTLKSAVQDAYTLWKRTRN